MPVKRLALLRNLEAEMVPLMVSDLKGGWPEGVPLVWPGSELESLPPSLPLWRLEVLRSSKGTSPGGSNPDLYFSITASESCQKETVKENETYIFCKAILYSLV